MIDSPHSPPPHIPKILWIGCSDARVPESVMWSPRKHCAGEIFVQRNIANQFHLTDNNAVSVLTYGVTGITGHPIKEIRVVGHTDCGGVKACYKLVRGDDSGISIDSVLWTWLGPLKRLAALHFNKSADELAAINVEEQIKNVNQVLDQLKVKNVEVKGFIYNVTTGNLKPVGVPK